MADLLQMFAANHLAAIVSFLEVFLAAGVVVFFADRLWSRLRPTRHCVSHARRAGERHGRSLLAHAPKLATLDRPRTATPSRGPQPSPPATRVVQKLSHAECAAACIQSAIQQGSRARQLHASAATRLGSADYGFRQLREELAMVMKMPVSQPAFSQQPRRRPDATPLATRLAA